MERALPEREVDGRLDGPRELLEDHVLVLHLGHEPGGLEQPGAVPPARRLVALVGGLERGCRPDGGVDLVGHPVVLGVEDVVHRGEADVLVAAAVAGDEVLVQQGGVVASLRRVGVVRDVVEERDVGLESRGRVDRRLE